MFRPFITLATAAIAAAGPASAREPQPFTPTAQQNAFTDDLSRRTFDYFWDTTDPRTCLALDRWPSAPFASIASIGFALTAYGVGAERRYVSRNQAATRTRDCLKYLLALPQGPQASGVAGYKGFFYHFLDTRRGRRYRDVELSTVDTSLLFGGVLFAQSYFDRDTAVERAIRADAEALYARADWTFFQRSRTGTQATNLKDSHGLSMGWKPGRGYEPHDWIGYNEGMLVYILAAASPTHPVGKDAWDKGWAARLEDDWGTYYGQAHLQFEPLFGHQYSHIWVDFRGIRDAFMAGKGIDYFENSRRATLAQRAYGSDNPNRWIGYSADIWGWTASDGPGGIEPKPRVNGTPRTFMDYSARGASGKRVVDDGTIAPTAAGGSIAFAPEVAIPALMAMKARYPRIWGKYGFQDAFNPSFTFGPARRASGTVDPKTGWVAGDQLGIDQGPILAMLENYRSELIWRTMRRNPYIRTGLTKLGFTGGWLDRGARPVEKK